MRVGVTLALGLALLTAAIAATLSGSPVVVLRSSSIQPAEVLAETNGQAGACQAGETLPAGTSAVRLSLQSVLGPRVSLTALSGSRLLTRGVAGSGWTGGDVTVPVRRLARGVPRMRICFRLGPTEEAVSIVGTRTGRAVAAASGEGRALPGRMRIEYLRAAHKSWWSMADVVARRMGLGRAPAGGWIAIPLFMLMAGVVASASWLAFREMR